VHIFPHTLGNFCLPLRIVRAGGPTPFGSKGLIFVSTPQYQGYAPVAAAAKTNTLAIIAFVASFFISIVGIVLGHIALSQIKTTGEGGRGLAIAALVIGYVSVAFSVIFVVAFIAAAAANR
jgi:hypothetical protein